MSDIIEIRNPNYGFDIVQAPKGYGNWNEISFKGVAGGWLNPGIYVNNQAYAKLFLKEFSIRKKSATSGQQHWIGFSPSFPTQAGHIYICTLEVRNRLSALNNGRLVTAKDAAGGYDLTYYPWTANQTEYTRIWHTFVQASEGTGRAYIDAYPAVNGTDIQLDIRNLRYFDVTGVDPAYYEAIARLDYYAIRTSLEAVKFRTMPGITRKGNLLSLDTASETDIAEGVSCKAVTADKLKAYVNNSSNYPSSLYNLAKDPSPYETAWATWKQTSPVQHPFGDMVIFEHISQTANASWHLDSGSSTMAAWIGGVSGKYIVSMDIFDTSEGNSYVNTYAYSNGTPSAISGCSMDTGYVKNKWVHIAMLVTATATFQINMNIISTGVSAGVAGLKMSFRMRNFKIYRVTDVNASLYPAIAKGQGPLLQGVTPIRITGRSISYSKAAMWEVLANTQNRHCVVDATALNRAINFGRVRDVTCGALGFGLWKEISFDGGTTWQTITLDLLYSLQYDYKWRNGFSLRNSSSTTGQHWFGFSEPANGKRFPTEVGHRYVFIVDARNSGAATLSKGQVLQYSGASVTMTNGDALPHTANQTTYTRLYSTFIYNANAGSDGRAWLDIYPNVTGQVVQVDVSGWWHFDVTGMPDNDVATLATFSAARLNDIYFRYLIQKESVSPISEVIDLGSNTSVNIEAGRAYRLTASNSTYTLRAVNVPVGFKGEDAHITISTSASSVIQTVAPISLMGKILPSSLNYCTVTFDDGVARLYVDKSSAGYIVVYAESTYDDGGLCYGITRSNASNQEYILFADVTNDVQIYSPSAENTTKSIILVGNGTGKTNISFSGNNLKVTQGITVKQATLKDVNVTGGMVTLSDARLDGTVRLSGGSVTLEKYTQLDSNIIGSGIVVNNNSIIRGSGTVDLNQQGHITCIGCTLDGITIENGKFAGYGGGFWGDNTSAEQHTLNCTIRGCSASASGGGFSYRYKYGSIVNVSVYGCTSGTYGGAFEISHTGRSGNPTTVSNCYIDHCKATNGGGICAYNDYVIMSEITINVCTASLGSGLGVFSNAVVEATNCHFTDNINSCAIYVDNGATNITMKNCRIIGTTHGANYGGGFSTKNDGSAISTGFGILIEDCVFMNNDATAWGGGAIYASMAGSGYTFLVKNCEFYNNSAPTYGGGAIYITASAIATFENCVFSGNNPDAIRVNSSAIITLKNCTVVDDVSFYTGVTSGSSCIKIEGTFNFTGTTSVNPSGGRFEIVTGSIIDLSSNQNTNCIIGGTISAAGQFRVININNEPCDHLARSVTGSTITNEGKWLPSVTRLVIPANTTASFRSYALNNNSISNANGGSVLVTTSNNNFSLTDCTMSGNKAVNYGGVIHVAEGCTNVKIDINNCMMTNNYATYFSAMSFYAGTVTVTGCTVTGNTTADVGGALYVTRAAAYVTVRDCYFANNKANNGGAIYTSVGSTIHVIGTTITNNTVTTAGSAIGINSVSTKQIYENCIIDGNIVGMSSVNNTTILELRGYNKFTGTMTGTLTLQVQMTNNPVIDLSGNNNSVTIRGGTISSTTPVMIRDKDGKPHKYLARSITGSTITNMGLWLPAPGRLVVDTAGTYEVQGYTISNVAITTSSTDGSGAFITAGTVSMLDMLITNNKGARYGGGVCVNSTGNNYVVKNSTISYNNCAGGGAVFVQGACTVSIMNCIITGNTATYGSCVETYLQGTAELIDCDIYGNKNNNSGTILPSTSGRVVLERCHIHDNIGVANTGIHVYAANSYVSIDNCIIGENQNSTVVGVLAISGHNHLHATIAGTGTISIASGSTINLTGNSATNAISCNTITSTGTFAVIDTYGNIHRHNARTVASSTITNEGHWLPTATFTYSSNNQTIAMSDNEISNLSGSSSAITISGASNNITFTNIIINGVTSSAQGAAINITGASNNVTLKGCTISNNKTLYRTVSLPGTCNLTVEDCLFENNQKSGSDQATAGWAIGGAIAAGYTLTIRRSKFINNELYGGVFYISGSGTVTVDTMIFNNFRRDYGTIILGGTITGTTTSYPSSAAGFARPVLYHSGALTETSYNSTVRILAGTLFDVSDLTVAGMNATGTYYFISCGPISVGSFVNGTWTVGGSASMKCVDGVTRTFSGSGNYLSYRGKLMSTVPGAND